MTERKNNQGNDDLHRLLETAIEHHRTGALSQAETLYRRILDANPNHPDALNLLGVLASQMGRHDHAVKLISQAISLNAPVAIFHFNLGAAYRAMKQFEAARNSYATAVKLEPEYAEAHARLGEMLIMLDEPERAGAHLERSLELEPGQAVARSCLAVILNKQGMDFHRSGNIPEAIKLYRKALAVFPESADCSNNLGAALMAVGRSGEALDCFRAAVRIDPANIEARNNLAFLLHIHRKSDEAAGHFRDIIRRNPRHYAAHYRLGLILQQQGAMEEAAEHLRRAVQLNQRSYKAHYELGIVSQELRQYETAIEHLQWAARLKPDDPAVPFALGAVFHLRDEPEKAVEQYQRALELNPDSAVIHSSLGAAFNVLSRGEEAVLHHRKALVLTPDSARVLCNLATTLMSMGSYGEALTHLDRALQLDPDNAIAHRNRAEVLLITGNLAEGWPEYEWRLQIPSVQKIPDYPYLRWDGSSLEGKTILIYGEQGIGDEIRLASCYNDVIDRAEQCVIQCDPRLEPLYKRSFPRALIFAVLRNDLSYLERAPAIDCWSPDCSLPLYLRPSVERFPRHDGYLAPDPVRRDFWRKCLAERGQWCRVGISWRSSLMTHHRARCFPRLEQWKPIFDCPGVQFINLQYDTSPEEIKEAGQRFGITIHTWEDLDLRNDQDDVANLMSVLDLVITGATSIFTLAGAVGAPVWVFAPFDRFKSMLGTDHFPWFPSARAFIQPQPLSWEPVIKTMAEELTRMAGPHIT